jgi:hypothetical protein
MSGKGKRFFSSSESMTSLGLTQTPIYWAPAIFFPWDKANGKLTNRLHLIARVRMSSAICFHGAHSDSFTSVPLEYGSIKSGRQITVPLLTYHL